MSCQDKSLSTSETLRCGPMMRELGRWNRHTRAQSTRSRWLEWALALIARYEKLRARHGSPSMIIVRPLKLNDRLHERWILSSIRLYPQVNLSIQPILHLTVRGEAQEQKEQQGLRIASPQTLMSQTFRLFGEKTFFKHEAAARAIASGMKYLKPSSINGMRTGEANFGARQVVAIERGNPQTTFVKQENSRSFSTSHVERLELAPQSSLQLVFQRLQRIDEGKSGSSLLQQSINNLTLRVVRQTQRVEQRASGISTAVLMQPAAVGEQHRATPVLETEHRAEGVAEMFGRRTGVWTGNNSVQMSDLNMEQITEHVMRRIDDRVIALRERMGHV